MDDLNRPDALRTDGLTKHYGDVAALVDVTLQVTQGEVFGFLGPNGSGKTTMIRTILDELRPTAGRAWIFGMDCRSESVEIRRRIGYLPADLALYPNLTGGDTLRFFANLRGGVDWDYVDDLVDRFGAQLDKKVDELSSGNRQKIGLIQACMNRPDLLIMDEPSSGLDPLVQREFQQLVREVSAEGTAVFLSSHSLSEVQRVADRVGIIRHGRLVAVEQLAALQARASRRVDVEFETAVDVTALATITGVADPVVDGTQASFSFDGNMTALLRGLTDRFEILEISTREADLDEIFLGYYRDDVKPGGAEPGGVKAVGSGPPC